MFKGCLYCFYSDKERLALGKKCYLFPKKRHRHKEMQRGKVERSSVSASCLSVCVHVRVCVCVHVWDPVSPVCACMCVHTCILCVYVYIPFIQPGHYSIVVGPNEVNLHHRNTNHFFLDEALKVIFRLHIKTENSYYKFTSDHGSFMDYPFRVYTSVQYLVQYEFYYYLIYCF